MIVPSEALVFAELVPEISRAIALTTMLEPVVNVNIAMIKIHCIIING